MTTLQFHPVADIFPMMNGAEFDALKADIAATQLREPIWLHPDRRILDGRNRYRACCDLDIEPDFRTYTGPLDTPTLVQFVVSLNLKRRHLDSGQKAFVALEVERVLAEAARERQGARNDLDPTLPKDLGNVKRHDGESAAQAAAIVGTNRQYVSDAKRIQEQAPDLAQAVRQGDMKITTARRKLNDRLPEPVAKSEPAQRPVQKPLEITEPWQNPGIVGSVRIMCQDSMTLDELGLSDVDLVLTSPPYNVGIGYASYEDSKAEAEYLGMLSRVFANCYDALREGGRIAVIVPFGVGRNPWTPVAAKVVDLLVDQNFQLRGQIIWDKGTSGNRTSWGSWRSPSDPSLRDTSEAIIVAHKGPSAAHVPSDVMVADGETRVSPWLSSDLFMELAQDHWTVAPESAQRVGHPAPFPVALAERLIRFYGWPGCHVLDPFAGSGTVGVAAMKLQSKATLIDIDETYCRLAQDRAEKALRGNHDS